MHLGRFFENCCGKQIKVKIGELVKQILEVKNLPLAKGVPQSGGGSQHNPSLLSQTAPSKGAIDTTHLENQIDELVFELYGLTTKKKSVIC